MKSQRVQEADTLNCRSDLTMSIFWGFLQFLVLKPVFKQFQEDIDNERPVKPAWEFSVEEHLRSSVGEDDRQAGEQALCSDLRKEGDGDLCFFLICCKEFFEDED